MYHPHVSVGLKPKQYTKVVPSCPVCRNLWPKYHARKHVTITTYTADGKIASYKSVEVCTRHGSVRLQRWADSINAKLGIVLDPRYAIKDVNDGQ